MGNSLSSSPPSIKVISSDGRLQEFTQSMSASELMRKNPGQFVCDSNSLSVGCRVPGVAASDELQPRRLYFLLPMDLLYSVLTHEEMASLAAKSSKSSMKRSKSFGRKIFPVLSELCLIPIDQVNEKKVVEEEEEEAESSWRFDGGDVKISKQQRWWRPALDTINEEAPPCTL